MPSEQLRVLSRDVQDRDREWDHNQDRDQDWDRQHDREYNRDRGQERDHNQDRDRDRDHNQDRGRDRDEKKFIPQIPSPNRPASEFKGFFLSGLGPDLRRVIIRRFWNFR